MNSQRKVNSAENNNTERTAQSLSVTLDNRMDFYALGAYWIRGTLLCCYFWMHSLHPDCSFTRGGLIWGA